MDLALRQARPQDAAAMVELLAPIIAHGGLTAMEGPLTVEDQRAFIASFPARGVFTVALDGGRLVGMQDVLPLAPDLPALAHVGQISTFVSMAHHGQGVGRRLCHETFALARARGFAKLQATIRADNPRAVAFYMGQGFRLVGTMARHARINGVWIDEVLAERLLE